MTQNRTLCPYCGVGCGLTVAPGSGANPWRVTGDRAHPSSQGNVCVKGATIAEALDCDRLLYPQYRASLDQPFERISWDQALDLIVAQIRSILADHRPDQLCIYGSGQLQTEDYYVTQKLLKGHLGTNNFDSNSRLCMSSSVAAYSQSFGSDGPPCCYDDLEATDFALIIGANMADCHPIAFNRLAKYHKRHPDVKLVVVDPRCTATAAKADLHLAIQPGTDITLLNGIAHLILQMGGIDQDFIAHHSRDFEAYQAIIADYAPERVAAVCGVAIAHLEQTAQWWVESQRVLSLWSMGINQSSEGTAKARTLINLHLMTGQIGKPGAGPFSLTGQPNAMGGRETGGLAHILPGYRSVTNPQHRAELEAAWQLPPGQISPAPGKDAGEMIRSLERGEINLLWIMATNPLVSLPDLHRVKAAFQKSPFTILQDAYHPTETTAYAHLLLPAAQWSEKTGTMTNSERVVTLCQAFREPPGEARADWQIVAAVGQRLGFEGFDFADAAAVYREFAQLTAGRVCDLTGISHDRLRDIGPIQWPCPAGTEPQTHGQQLYANLQFPTPDGRARFIAVHSRGLAEPPDPDYPFVLTVGRLYGHWHTQTRTGRIPKITKMHPQPCLEIHPRDAEKYGISAGDWVVVRSRRGMARFQAEVTKAIAPGTLFIPMHWGALWGEDTEANALTHGASCPDSKQPELKACAVQIERWG